MRTLTPTGRAAVADALAPELTMTRLHVGITIDLPDRIAARLARPGLAHPHITIAGPAAATVDQIRRLRHSFDRRTGASPLERIGPFTVGLRGVGDFRAAPTPSPTVYVAIDDGGDRLAALAEHFDATFGLARTFPFHPHVTVGHGDDDVLDRAVADYADFAASFVAGAITLTVGVGPVGRPWEITWGTPQAYRLR